MIILMRVFFTLVELETGILRTVLQNPGLAIVKFIFDRPKIWTRILEYRKTMGITLFISKITVVLGSAHNYVH